MLEIKTYTCQKCGEKFTKAVGGVVMSPKQMELEMHPVCDRCKLKKVKEFVDIFKK